MPPPFSKYPPLEYSAEEPAEDFSTPNSESNYITPSSPAGYMPPNPQTSYTFPSFDYPSNPFSSVGPAGYMPPNPQASFSFSSFGYDPSNPFSSIGPKGGDMQPFLPPYYPNYMPYQPYNYFTPSLPPNYIPSPLSSYAFPSSPSYFAPSPQSISPMTPSNIPTTTQSGSASPTSPPTSYTVPSSPSTTTQSGSVSPTTSYTSPSTQPAVQPQSQTYFSANVIPQSDSQANQTSIVPTQQTVLSALPTDISSADNSTIVPAMITENATEINSNMTALHSVDQSGIDLSVNAVSSLPQAADETPIINSNGETSTDMNSLPPQVKEFIDMIPNILAMPDSQAMAPNDQMQPSAEGRPQPSPFSLSKSPKKLPLHKRKLLHPPSTHSPSFPPSYPPLRYPVSPYQSPPYHPPSHLSVPNY